MFEVFPWSPHLETGIAIIDEQHRKLVSLINRLAQQHVDGASEAEMVVILGELADYADYHFKTEEGIWHSALAGNAWFDQHVATHQAFFAHIVELHAGDRPFQAVLDDLFSYLIRWLAYHILDNDKRMAMAVLAIQEGLPLAAAQARAEAQMQGATATLIHTVLGMYQTLSTQALDLMHEKLARQRAENALESSELRWRSLLDGLYNPPHIVTPAERRLRAVIDNVPAGLIAADMTSHRFVFANRWFCQMLGYSLEDLLQMDPSGIHPAEAMAQVKADFERLSAGEVHAAVAIPVQRKDGSVFIANIERVPLTLDGQTSALAIFTDVTESHAAAMALETERLRLQNAIDAAQAGTWEWDIAARVVHFSERTAAMLGHAARATRQGTYDDYMGWIHPEDQPRVQQSMARHLAGESPHFEGEMRMRHADGHWVWCRSLGRVMQRGTDGAPQLVAGISIDISEHKMHREQIDYVSHHDALTGLPNRKLFVELLGYGMKATHDPQQLAVAYIDLDGFAAINEAQGRDIGNQLIVQVSRRLASAVHLPHQLAHIGGDEFAVILSDLTQADAHVALVLRLLAVVAQPLTLPGLSFDVTASIGVALYRAADRVDAEQLLRQADQAMYLAKLAGKNRHHLFDPVTDETTRQRFTRQDEIRQALAHDEFVLYYQPKVNLSSGEVIGFEALIRWQHPQRGLLAPGLFIPLLERHPLAIALGDWVIEAALAQLARWNAQGLRTTVSVNIDAMQLHDPDFADRLQRQIEAQPVVLPPQLELEILETGALEDMAHVSALIARLQGMGIECALDDFGTGYSSLTFLKQLTARTVKIDQSFVRGMLDDAEDATIVNSVLALARNFDRRALAEGIETEANGTALIEFGCTFGQGYLIARPMPAAQVEAWLGGWQTPPAWARSSAVGPRDIPLLLAEAEHRGWFKRLQAQVAGRAPVLPPDSSCPCRFGEWLQRPTTRQRFASHAGFARLEAVHRELHLGAMEILTRLQADAAAAVSAELACLAGLSDDLLAQLFQLRQKPPAVSWSSSGFADL